MQGYLKTGRFSEVKAYSTNAFFHSDLFFFKQNYATFIDSYKERNNMVHKLMSARINNLKKKKKV